MKLIPALFCALFATTTCALAAAPATNAAPATAGGNTFLLKGTSVYVSGQTITMSGSLTLPAPAAPTLTLNAYINDLKQALNLSDSEKQQVKNAYVNDGTALQSILNDTTLSPLQQARQVSDLRDARNAKIEALLFDFDRKQEFLQIEAKYRVALTLLAADGGLVAPAPAVK